MTIKKKLIISSSYTLLVSAVLFVLVNSYFKPLDISAFIIGTLFGMCNFYVVLWAWSRIFIKKRIALASGVIVIKYAIVLFVLYYLFLKQNFDVISFVLGTFSMVTITLFLSVFMIKKT